MLTLAELTTRFPRAGEVIWIGVRPQKHAELIERESVEIAPNGLDEDYRARPGKRAVSLIQAEHLPVISALSATPGLGFAALRRNIAVAGINLSAARGRTLRLGSAVLRLTGACAPCSRMESILGTGGYNAMRGHGGMVAEVIEPGTLGLGDPVVVEPAV